MLNNNILLIWPTGVKDKDTIEKATALGTKVGRRLVRTVNKAVGRSDVTKTISATDVVTYILHIISIVISREALLSLKSSENN